MGYSEQFGKKGMGEELAGLQHEGKPVHSLIYTDVAANKVRQKPVSESHVMTSYKIEAGTAQHLGNRPQQNDRVALMTGARAPGYVLAVLSDGAFGAAASSMTFHAPFTFFHVVTKLPRSVTGFPDALCIDIE